MTRINLVKPQWLCNQHLFAEWREMPRLVGNLHKSMNRVSKPWSDDEIPLDYILGSGHIKFFYDKFEFLHKRHIEITKELLRRDYTLSNSDSNIFMTVPKKYYNDYRPKKSEIIKNIKRIINRMPNKPRY